MVGAPHEYAAGPADESLDGCGIAAGVWPAVSAPSTLASTHARTNDGKRMGTSLDSTREILSAAPALVNQLDECQGHACDFCSIRGTRPETYCSRELLDGAGNLRSLRVRFPICRMSRAARKCSRDQQVSGRARARAPAAEHFELARYAKNVKRLRRPRPRPSPTRTI